MRACGLRSGTSHLVSEAIAAASAAASAVILSVLSTSFSLSVREVQALLLTLRGARKCLLHFNKKFEGGPELVFSDYISKKNPGRGLAPPLHFFWDTISWC